MGKARFFRFNDNLSRNMKYAVIGTGAIGAYYGAKLAYAGNDVHFLLHSDYDFVKENGLQ
ncbi:MAG: 2-dehydropantoate 2-reductase N-terminal domain-containing protein, partial [Muribaculaceae bacterium]|nr:2-dehydropantoate 2-reductase N-terminal domain-containing protein [Muribaculaceae bacterium]